MTDSLADDVLYPTAQRLLQHCDAVLRLLGSYGNAVFAQASQFAGVAANHC